MFINQAYSDKIDPYVRHISKIVAMIIKFIGNLSVRGWSLLWVFFS